jgi:hypothetical protein
MNNKEDHPQGGPLLFAIYFAIYPVILSPFILSPCLLDKYTSSHVMPHLLTPILTPNYIKF